MQDIITVYTHVYYKLSFYLAQWPITVAARSKVWTVLAHSNTGIVGSNHTRGLDICVHLFYVFVVFCLGSGLVTVDPPSRETYQMCID
jgi:hypothetical protein